MTCVVLGVFGAFLFVDQYLGPIKLAPTLVVTLKSVDKGEEEMGFQPRGGFSWLVVVGCAGGGCVFEADVDDSFLVSGFLGCLGCC